jgi:hypothetical protein
MRYLAGRAPGLWLTLLAASSRYPLTGCATEGCTIKIKLFTLPGSDAVQAAASNRNGKGLILFFYQLIFYLFLSFKSQIARAARTTTASALGQTGISTPAATTLTPKITRHNWAMAIKRNKIAATNDAGRFILLPPYKISL